ncbi:hypothetical protein DESUT3_20100 [Desulfuromonas versatilis]|uniref:Uncharacterized protein n=1 Tax=Desulfuromonas versatilis TaxID=2802975 RepID=A0ABM8HSK9_9BACT|nr:hypothetical protein DESUT3_20100 [Desulfuromonas versatilis]
MDAERDRNGIHLQISRQEGHFGQGQLLVQPYASDSQGVKDRRSHQKAKFMPFTRKGQKKYFFAATAVQILV